MSNSFNATTNPNPLETLPNEALRDRQEENEYCVHVGGRFLPLQIGLNVAFWKQHPDTSRIMLPLGR